MLKRYIYVSPTTAIAPVELGGFICQSIDEMTVCLDVDEIVNQGAEDLQFNSDWQ